MNKILLFLLLILLPCLVFGAPYGQSNYIMTVSDTTNIDKTAGLMYYYDSALYVANGSGLNKYNESGAVSTEVDTLGAGYLENNGSTITILDDVEIDNNTFYFVNSDGDTVLTFSPADSVIKLTADNDTTIIFPDSLYFNDGVIKFRQNGDINIDDGKFYYDASNDSGYIYDLQVEFLRPGVIELDSIAGVTGSIFYSGSNDSLYVSKITSPGITVTTLSLDSLYLDSGNFHYTPSEDSLYVILTYTPTLKFDSASGDSLNLDGSNVKYSPDADSMYIVQAKIPTLEVDTITGDSLNFDAGKLIFTPEGDSLYAWDIGANFMNPSVLEVDSANGNIIIRNDGLVGIGGAPDSALTVQTGVHIGRDLLIGGDLTVVTSNVTTENAGTVDTDSLNVDTNTLIVSNNHDNVGIGAAADSQLTVNNGAHIGRDLLVDGDIAGGTITGTSINITNSEFDSLNVDNGVFVVSPNHNKVGVGTAAPDSELTVNTGLHVGRDAIIDGDQTVTGSITCSTIGASGSAVAGLTITASGNTFNLTRGTGSLDVAAGKSVNIDENLTVNTEAITLNQSLGTTDNVQFDDVTCDSLNVDTNVLIVSPVDNTVGIGGAADSALTVTGGVHVTRDGLFDGDLTAVGITGTTLTCPTIGASGNTVAGLVITAASNAINLTQGTASIDIATGIAVNIDQNLTVNTEAVTLNQSLSTTDDVQFNSVTADSLYGDSGNFHYVSDGDSLYALKGYFPTLYATTLTCPTVGVSGNAIAGLTITATSNTFNLTRGTGSLDVAEAKTINFDQDFSVTTESVTIDQSLSTTDDVQFNSVTTDSIYGDAGAVVLSGDHNTLTLNGYTVSGNVEYDFFCFSIDSANGLIADSTIVWTNGHRAIVTIDSARLESELQNHAITLMEMTKKGGSKSTVDALVAATDDGNGLYSDTETTISDASIAINAKVYIPRPATLGKMASCTVWYHYTKP